MVRDYSYLQRVVVRLPTWPQFAYPGLLDQSTFRVVVGDAGGDADRTGLGTRGPRGGLHNAFGILKRVPVWLKIKS